MKRTRLWTFRTVLLANLVVLAITTPARAVAGQLLWDATYDGTGNGLDNVNDLSVSPTGETVFVTGQGEGINTHFDITTVAYDSSNGDQLWAKRYDGPAHRDDYGLGITTNPDGTRVFVTGQSRGKGSAKYDAVTIAYDAVTGAKLWVKRYNTGAGVYDSGNAITSLGSKVFVFVNGPELGLLVAYATETGSLKWSADVGKRALAGALDLEAAAKNVYAIGTQFSAQYPLTDYLMAKFKTKNGALVWRKQYDGPASFVDTANDAALSSDASSLYVTGKSSNFGQDTITTIKLETTGGSREWDEMLAPQALGFDVGPRLAVSPDGLQVFLTAASYDGAGLATFLTTSYSSDGVPGWTARENGPDETGSPYGIAASGDGLVYVTGVGASTTGNTGFLTEAYSAETGGPPMWTAFVPGVVDGDGALSLGIAPDDSAVYVGGMYDNDYHTEAYSTS